MTGIILGFSFGVFEWVLAYSNAYWVDRMLAIIAHMFFGIFGGKSIYFCFNNKWKKSIVNLGIALICHIFWNETSILVANWDLFF
ncbi:MAG: hypothetical protein ACTSXD_01055 [Candidatus Heimdallarchaeaceae archaeon]